MTTHKRVALVTGAARGIGCAVAERLAKGGFHVVLADVLAQVEETVAALRTAGLSVEATVGDVSDEAWVRQLASRVERERGGVDILINNAGILPRREGVKVRVLDADLATWERTLAVNLTGAFLTCRAFVPSMVGRGWGRVINMTSQAARGRSDVAAAGYVASKAGLIGFSRVLATEVASAGVTVNCIAPGRIDTDMVKISDPVRNRQNLNQIPVGRVGTGSDIAETAAFLASEEASFITGAIFDVNGGAFMA